ncbi:AAA ATPase [Leptospira ryugenii]|uniref:AAA ATPase n=1 Tax=Leptospira ryugenii TaxID=1917863 RepID=A0A2P2DWH2_9LEPT|nr:AAA family ATPase [Leptospira ryugenii]GBF48995.1 AAA ATPase [Leptospira ryugenii]
MSTQSSPLDFFRARELLLHELPKQAFEFLTEKEETIFRMHLPDPGKVALFDALGVLRNFIENYRIYNFESNYLSLQALPDNLFEVDKNLSQRIRFRFSFGGPSLKWEASKRGDFSQREIQACIALSQHFSGAEKKTQEPKEILQKLGVEVYDPLASDVAEYSFSQIAGYQEVKDQILESLVMPTLHPKPFQEITKLTRVQASSILPRAVLFEGEPGVGKTSMAKVASYMAKIPLVYVPIESILSKYYGESSQNLAMIFDATALFPRSFLFLDEIDSLATSREDGLFEATRNLLSVLLRKLDGFAKTGNLITIGATNRKKDLDPALVSRFDRKIYFPLPKQEERTKILANYAKQLTDQERAVLSVSLEGASGRNLKDFCDFVERTWITKQIREGKGIEAPPFDLYRSCLTDFHHT